MKDLSLPDVLGLTTDEAIRRLQIAGAVCKVAFTSSKKGIMDPDGDRVLQLRQNGNEVTLVAAAVRTKPKKSADAGGSARAHDRLKENNDI